VASNDCPLVTYRWPLTSMAVAMSPNIKHLKAFLHVAQSGGFILGAIRANMSQPTLSRTIKMLEEDVGTRLFDRDVRGTVLTPAGRELVAVAQRLIERNQVEWAHFQRFLNGEQGRVGIATLPSLSSTLLPGAITRLSATHPDLQFGIDEAAAEEVECSVLKGTADIGLTVKPADEALFEWEPLLTDRFGLVMRTDDPLAQNAACDWQVLARRAFASHVSGTSHCRYQTSALWRAGIQAEPAIRCREIATLAAFVESGFALGLLPQLCMPLIHQPALTWRPLVGPVASRQLGTLLRRGGTPGVDGTLDDSGAAAHRPAAVEALLAALRAVAASTPIPQFDDDALLPLHAEEPPLHRETIQV
jgi:LysR family carnitine catabolism transcriptional activator